MKKMFEEIEKKYDYLPELYHEIKEAYEAGNITDMADIEDYIEEYITEEDEMTLGEINLWAKIEERDFVHRIFKI